MTSSPQDSSHRSIGPNSLLDLEIPGAVGPLPEPPAEPGKTLWGINHGAALDNFPQNGLQLYIPAWSAMGQGDSVVVLLDNKVVTTEFIEAAEVGLRVTAFIESERLTSGNHTLQYRVTRLSQSAEISAGTDVLVKLDRPGGQDQNGEAPGHSALKLTLPQQIINDGVDDTDAEAGVPVTIEPYPYMAAGDDIKLSWGGEFVHHKVTAGEVDQSVEITVDKAVILAGGDSGANGLAVTFEVYDMVDNRSEDWAAEIRIVVDTGNSRLGSPFVKEALSNVLDLDTLAGGPVTVQIVAATTRAMLEQLSQSLTPEQAARLQASMGKETFSRLGALRADFVMGDKILVKLTGTTAEGDPVSYEAAEITIDRLPHVFEAEIPNAVVRQLAQTQAVFSYRLIHLDSTESKSRGAFISVVGEAVRMAAPVALDAAQGAIDPALPSTVVQIPWDDSMAAGDQLILKWVGTRPDLTIYDPELNPHNITSREATAKAPINFTVPGTHLKAIEGGTLGLYFILAKDVDGTIVNRESARATLLKVGEARAELPAPVVAGVVNEAIDPAYGATTLTVRIYPDMAIGDDVHYLWRGSVNGDVEDSLKITSFTLNKPVVFDLYPDDISANDGGTVEASYWVIRASGRRSDSEVMGFTVGAGQQPLLVAPSVPGSEDGILEIEEVPSGAQIVVPHWEGMESGDVVTINWKDDKGTPAYTANKNITGAAVGKDVSFSVTLAEVRKSVDGNVTVSYTVIPMQGDEKPSLLLTFSVQGSTALPLSAPSIVEAVGSKLDPNNVLNGAHVTIGIGAQLAVRDEVTLTWMGQSGNSSVSFVQQATAAGVMTFDVAYATVAANAGYSVTLNYTVKRASGATEGPSPDAVYDVKIDIGAGKLNIMGARFNRASYRASATPRRISAFNATTGAALSPQWQYEGDGASWTQGTSFRDKHPDRVLRIRTSDDMAALNPNNVVGSGDSVTNQGALVAHLDTGDVIGWGNAAYGAQIPSSIIAMDDIVEVSCTRSAYAARRLNGYVVVWGNAAEGGSLAVPKPGTSAADFIHIASNSVAFAGIKTAGNLVAWGLAGAGGTVPAEISALTDISQIVGGRLAFAAIRNNGQVVAWGVATEGGTVPDDIASLTDIIEVSGNSAAFAAMRSNGRVVAWGTAANGGTVPPVIAALTNIAELGCSTTFAFSLITKNGQVRAWGDATYGGVVPEDIKSLTDIIEVSSTWLAFAARRGNGHVVAWGLATHGGIIPQDIASLDDIVQVVGSGMAFAALRRNGTVVAWGDAKLGGDTSTVVTELRDVQAVYANSQCFVALTSDGRVVTWPSTSGGGDSSAIQSLVRGKLSYQAT
ncbi:RCC1 domain-containing protein [Pseudomonas huanghezhanensis]|uniref:hypothetical protein n=1 Tax=Pseudomonas huanghezhanensis TaxID=3002903 RepID=UPI002285E833|nr:hypothetical protein [Pseudomonas sp. BSw22131]